MSQLPYAPDNWEPRPLAQRRPIVYGQSAPPPMGPMTPQQRLILDAAGTSPMPGQQEGGQPPPMQAGFERPLTRGQFMDESLGVTKAPPQAEAAYAPGAAKGFPPMPGSSAVGNAALADSETATDALSRRLQALAPPPGPYEKLMAGGAPIINELRGSQRSSTVLGPSGGVAGHYAGFLDRDEELARLQNERAEEARRVQMGAVLQGAAHYPQLYQAQGHLEGEKARIQAEMGPEKRARDAEDATMAKLVLEGKMSNEEAHAVAKNIGDSIRGVQRGPGGAVRNPANPPLPTFGPLAGAQWLKDRGIVDPQSGQFGTDKFKFDVANLGETMANEDPEKMRALIPLVATQLSRAGVAQPALVRALDELLIRKTMSGYDPWRGKMEPVSFETAGGPLKVSAGYGTGTTPTGYALDLPGGGGIYHQEMGGVSPYRDVLPTWQAKTIAHDKLVAQLMARLRAEYAGQPAASNP